MVWKADSFPAKWLTKLDAIVLESLDPEDVWNRRWLRVLPRYAGRLEPNVRMVCGDREFATKIVERLRGSYDCGDIEAEATVLVESEGRADEYHFGPDGPASRNQP